MANPIPARTPARYQDVCDNRPTPMANTTRACNAILWVRTRRATPKTPSNHHPQDPVVTPASIPPAAIVNNHDEQDRVARLAFSMTTSGVSAYTSWASHPTAGWPLSVTATAYTNRLWQKSQQG